LSIRERQKITDLSQRTLYGFRGCFGRRFNAVGQRTDKRLATIEQVKVGYRILNPVECAYYCIWNLRYIFNNPCNKIDQRTNRERCNLNALRKNLAELHTVPACSRERFRISLGPFEPSEKAG